MFENSRLKRLERRVGWLDRQLASRACPPNKDYIDYLVAHIARRLRANYDLVHSGRWCQLELEFQSDLIGGGFVVGDSRVRCINDPKRVEHVPG